MQSELNFSVHERENNPESEMILQENKQEFSDQCKLIYQLLKEGKSLTVRSALLLYGIGSLPRRILDLKQKGVLIQSRLIDKKYKEYYL